jgi:threonine aldolase
MGNLACIMAQTSRGQEVICEAAGHIYSYEMASMTALGGVLPRLVAGSDGILTWDKIAPAIREKVYYRPQTTLISLENTHNMAGGTVYPTEVAEEICDRAHKAGISVHLDGARIFNAAVYLRQDVAAITKKFDSVQFCLSKGLGAPVGSMIVGSKILSNAAVSFARCWAAVCGRLVCWAARAWWPWKRPKLLPGDHDNAQILAQGLARFRAFKSIRQSSDEYRHIRRWPDEIDRSATSRKTQSTTSSNRGRGWNPHPRGHPPRRQPGRLRAGNASYRRSLGGRVLVSKTLSEVYR